MGGAGAHPDAMHQLPLQPLDQSRPAAGADGPAKSTSITSTRTEKRLGLTGQPRLIYHVKRDRQGIPREHYHAIWSRIDVERRAIHMAYDQDKLMTVTREFARDHGLRLPEGYDKHKVSARRDEERQMTGMTSGRRTGAGCRWKNARRR